MQDKTTKTILITISVFLIITLGLVVYVLLNISRQEKPAAENYSEEIKSLENKLGEIEKILNRSGQNEKSDTFLTENLTATAQAADEKIFNFTDNERSFSFKYPGNWNYQESKGKKTVNFFDETDKLIMILDCLTLATDFENLNFDEIYTDKLHLSVGLNSDKNKIELTLIRPYKNTNIAMCFLQTKDIADQDLIQKIINSIK